MNMQFNRIGRGQRWIGIASLVCAAACSPTSLVDVQTPDGIVDPSTIATPEAAAQFYNFAVGNFAAAFGGGNTAYHSYVATTGIFTDELQYARYLPYVDDNTTISGIDERFASDPLKPGAGYYNNLYTVLHQARTLQQQGREALKLYSPGSAALQGRLAAQEAYSIVLLAELYCSGIPLTKVPLRGAPQYTRGFSTQELLETAIALFDSAATMAADSARFVNMAKVGKGRALLDLGKPAEAATAAQGVPTDFVYNETYGPVKLIFSYFPNSGYQAGNMIGGAPQIFQAVDHEGGNGLVWSTDPRTGVDSTQALTGAMWVPAKYSVVGGALDPSQQIYTASIHLADGLEARLIEAEADLAAGGSNWLTILNTLRSTCVGSAPCAPVPGLTALPAMIDPGTPAARLDSLMKERAMWLYLTGHRQGDLRRLAHVYQRPVSTVYPTGTYENPGFAPSVLPATTHGQSYGNDVVFTVPSSEQLANSLYSGCINTAP